MKGPAKRLLKIFAGVAVLFLLLVGAMAGVMATVVEATKETRADASSGRIKVAANGRLAMIGNPHFTTAPAAAALSAVAATAAAAAAGVATTAAAAAAGAAAAPLPAIAMVFVDGAGHAISTAPLTAPDRAMVDAYGNFVRTEKKMFEDLFAGDRLTDLLHADRDALASVATLETSDSEGRHLTLGVTGHAFRDFHFVRAGSGQAAALYIPAPAADAAPPAQRVNGTRYDLAMHVLVIHTADARFPTVVGRCRLTPG